MSSGINDDTDSYNYPTLSANERIMAYIADERPHNEMQPIIDAAESPWDDQSEDYDPDYDGVILSNSHEWTARYND